MEERKAPSRGVLVYALLFAALCVLLIWRARFGAVWDDEAYYLTIPYQMTMGDSLLTEQWNMAQMFAFLTAPLVRLYYVFRPSGDGIVLASRYAFVFFHALTSLYIFLRLRKKSFVGAAAASLIYLQFIFSDLMSLSYNTMGVGLVIFSCLTLGLGRGRDWEYLLAGLAFAAAVLCMPFLVLIYAAYTLAVLLCRKRGGEIARTLSLRGWLLFTASCAALAALFFLRVAVLSDLRLLPQTLAQILHDDAHPIDTPTQWARGYYNAFYRRNAFFKPVLYGSAALAAVILLDRGRLRRRPLYLLAALVLAGVFSLPYLLMYPSPNYFMFPYSILGFFAWLLCEKREDRLFALMYVPGMLYWACADMASDLGFYNITAVSVVNMPVSILCLAKLLEEMRRDAAERQRWLRLSSGAVSALACALVLTLFGASIRCEMRMDASGTPLHELEAVTTCGAQKGCRVRPEANEAYTAEYEALAPLREIREGTVLYLARNSVRYLEDGKRYASPDMWFVYFTPQDGLKRLTDYWAMFPERRPDYVYLNEAVIEAGYLPLFTAWDCTAEPVGTGVILTMDWSEA